MVFFEVSEKSVWVYAHEADAHKPNIYHDLRPVQTRCGNLKKKKRNPVTFAFFPLVFGNALCPCFSPIFDHLRDPLPALPGTNLSSQPANRIQKA
jgi:hypothetical protein